MISLHIQNSYINHFKGKYQLPGPSVATARQDILTTPSFS